EKAGLPKGRLFLRAAGILRGPVQDAADAAIRGVIHWDTHLISRGVSNDPSLRKIWPVFPLCKKKIACRRPLAGVKRCIRAGFEKNLKIP
ncbi:MAG TPA: hypothetical protein VLH60_05985, partial [Sedimentisphaerales bacterium]|nr:hypothetical protein [Sedimentisphaerales bacterium]